MTRQRDKFPTRIQSVLIVEGVKTIGQIREISDEVLLSYQDFGSGSVAYRRQKLGLPSYDGVRPSGLKGTRT